MCSRCGYTEQRNMTIGGKHKNIVPATCLNPSYCTACGATISSALGHDWGEWEYTVAPTCLKDGHEKRVCQRCNFVEERDCNALGHDYQPAVTIPDCVTNGTSTYICTRCGDSYVDKSEWSAWTADYNEQYFKDNLIPSSMYESRTEYRYRDKQYTTSTSSSSSATKSGWTLYNTTSERSGDYEGWSSWSTSYPGNYSYRDIGSKTQYGYYHYSLTKQNGTVTACSSVGNKHSFFR